MRAETVILAIGTQGNPNKMRCGGADLPHVQYQLDDPEGFVDEHIVVVGSGDAGIEKALGLAADPEQGNVVTLLTRGADFARAKAALNAHRIAARDFIGIADFSRPSSEPRFHVVAYDYGVKRNILRKLDPTEVEGSPWDQTSIMHYAFPGGLIKDPETVRGGNGAIFVPQESRTVRWSS